MTLFLPDPSYLVQPFLDSLATLPGMTVNAANRFFINGNIYGPLSTSNCPAVDGTKVPFSYTTYPCSEALYSVCQYLKNPSESEQNYLIIVKMFSNYILFFNNEATAGNLKFFSVTQ